MIPSVSYIGCFHKQIKFYSISALVKCLSSFCGLAEWMHVLLIYEIAYLYLCMYTVQPSNLSAEMMIIFSALSE